MKNVLLGFISIIFFLLLNSLSCDEVNKPDKDDDKGKLIENEKITSEVSGTYNGTDLELAFENNSKFIVKADENATSNNQKITISIIENERFFNAPNNIVYDFSKLKNVFYFNFEYVLPKNLVEEDITLFIYSPANTENELDAVLLNFDYNTTTGILSAKFYAPSENPITGMFNKKQNTILNNGKYTRLSLSWLDRSTLANAPIKTVIEMPFYEQVGSSCWAACATMLARAYTPVNDRKRDIKIIDFVKGLGHSTLDEGIGLWAFRKHLPAQIGLYTGLTFETSTFVSKSNLLQEIVSKLDENIPVIVNLRYPNVGGHAILVVGYEIDLVSAAKISVKLLYHNPQNTTNEAMYKWADYDWLVKDKWATEAFQILYANQAVPSSRALQTVGFPLKNYFGDFSFIVPIKRPSDGKIIDFPINMSYKQNAYDAYVWVYSLGNVELSVIPDSASKLKMNIPVYNAATISKNLNFEIRSYDDDTGELLYENSKISAYSPGNNKLEAEIMISEFADAKKEVKVRMKIELWDGGTYLDGYTVIFTVAPKLEIEFTCFGELWGITKQVCPNATSTVEAEHRFGVQKMMLTGNGKKYEGTMETTMSGHQITTTVFLEYDKDVNPKFISELSLDITTDVYYSGEMLGTQKNYAKLKNIDIRASDKKPSYWYIVRDGNEVCPYIDKITYTYTSVDPNGCSMELINYNCSHSNTQLNITIK